MQFYGYPTIKLDWSWRTTNYFYFSKFAETQLPKITSFLKLNSIKDSAPKKTSKQFETL